MNDAKVGRGDYGLAFVSLLGLALASPTWADVGIWTSHGPEGGNIRAIAIDPVHPSTVYAGSSGGGVFKSTDGGDRWAAANAGLTNLNVNALIVDPAMPATLFAATDDGVFRSFDGGQSWTAAGAGLASPYVNSLAISTSGLYAGSGAGNGVYRSSDGGESWSPANAGLPGGSVDSLAIDPSAPSTIYAGSGGVFKSTDAGQSWTKASIGMESLIFEALAIDPSKPSTVYAATYAFDYPADGVFRSTDGGAHWDNAIGPGFRNRTAYSLALTPSHPNIVYAGTRRGVVRSTNGGVYWHDAGTLDLAVLALAIDPSTPSTVYAGTFGGGVFKTTNGGGSWSPANAGLIASDVRALAVSPSGATAYAALATSLSKTSDGGETWATMESNGGPRFVTALAIDPSAPATLYVGNDTGAFRSRDAGGSWTAINSGLTDPGGAVRPVTSLAISPSAPAMLYAGTYDGVVKSLDGGDSWTAAEGALPEDWRTIYGLVVDPAAPATLYALTNGGVFKTVDGAASWTGSLTNRFVSAVGIAPSAPSTLYAASAGIFKSIDGGASWNPTPANPPNTAIAALVVDPESADTLYAAGGIVDPSNGTPGGGVFRSNDGGETWQALNEGLTTTDVRNLALDSSTRRLYAGSSGGGVFQRDLRGPLSCTPTPTRHCLVGNRYAVDLTARPGARASGAGVARPLGDRAGYFTLPFVTGDAELPEVIVKMLDDGAFGTSGAPFFYASLTTLPYVLTVTDTRTGRVASYSSNPGAPLCGGATLAFAEARSTSRRAAMGVQEEAAALVLLEGRFSVTLEALFPESGRITRGTVLAASDAYGIFSLPEVTGDPQVPEVVVKMVDARSFTGDFWFFHTGLTSLDYTLTVVDSVTGAARTYDRAGDFCGAADIHAFAASPGGAGPDPRSVTP